MLCVRCFAMGFHPSKARHKGQFLLAQPSAPRGPLHHGVISPRRITKSPRRFREQAFLDLLWRAYRRLVGREWNGTDPGRVVALVDIHDTLTLLLGSDYAPEEFARDLL